MNQIPNSVIAVVGEVLGYYYYNHTKLDTLFWEHGAPGEPPGGNVVVKCTQWLKRCNEDPSVDAFAVLGGVLEEFMDKELYGMEYEEKQLAGRERVKRALAQHGLSYGLGGVILGATAGAPSRSLDAIIRERDLKALEIEFQRALASVERDPPAAATAACAVIEALCKVVIEAERLEMPTMPTIMPLWRVVQPHLGLDPAAVESADVKRILGGLVSVVDGVGSLRTHAGSAHGHGRDSYPLDAAHARLAVHAAHTVATFVLELWGGR